MSASTVAQPSPDELVVVKHLTKRYGDGGGLFRKPRILNAVNDVSLTMRRGESVALVGESGSGKTTFGRCLLRLVEPTGGTIHFDGVDVLALRGQALRRFRRRMQIVFQDPSGSLNPRMRVGPAVREPIEVHGIARGAESRRRVESLFDEVGLNAELYDRYPHELSGGQKQRVGLARALSINPDFLVLDEPVSALDVSVQAQVLNLLESLRRRRGLTYLFIAHDLAVVRQIADRVAVMYLGRLVEQGSSETVYEDPQHPYTTALLSAAPIPDPGAASVRITLTGELPSPTDLPPGCAFESRCPNPKKDERCRTERPELEAKSAGHEAACFYPGVRLGKDDRERSRSPAH
jgi:oligopeptide/dipeptide ABC transporter ATP-binding protein